jgi:hypothetical protein
MHQMSRLGHELKRGPGLDLGSFTPETGRRRPASNDRRRGDDRGPGNVRSWHLKDRSSHAERRSRASPWEPRVEYLVKPTFGFPKEAAGAQPQDRPRARPVSTARVARHRRRTDRMKLGDVAF